MDENISHEFLIQEIRVLCDRCGIVINFDYKQFSMTDLLTLRDQLIELSESLGASRK